MQIGKFTPPYAKVLRALGRYIDENGLTNVRVIESSEGLVLQAYSTEERGKQGQLKPPTTYLLGEEEILELLKQGFELRGTNPESKPLRLRPIQSAEQIAPESDMPPGTGS